MKSLLQEDDPEQSRGDADLTLGIGSLLSIFFGVVLICGIFFGFGYSMGRRNAHPAPAPVASTPKVDPNQPSDDISNTLAQPKPNDNDAPLPPLDSNAPGLNDNKASASTPPPVQPSSPPTKEPATPAAPAKAEKPPRVVEPNTPSTTLTAVPFTHRAPLPTKPHAGIMATPDTPPPADASATPGHPIMVQIAAVSRQEDANVLADALRKRGFTPQVRGGTTDKFFHVQVGPFTDKAEAETMKQHLLADGYNAIVK